MTTNQEKKPAKLPKFRITTVISQENWEKAKRFNWGWDELIRNGMLYNQDMPGYLQRIRELEELDNKKERAIVFLNKVVTDQNKKLEDSINRITNLEKRVTDLEDNLKHFSGESDILEMEKREKEQEA